MPRPNILFIMADQMAAPLLPLHDAASPIRMPNLMRLAEQAVVFDSAYCNSPLCAPSRFTLVSGQLPTKIGAWDNAADFAADVPTYAHHLRRLGYRTALSGKMHFCGPDQLHGYEERLTSDIYPADYGWAVNWDEPEVRPSWYHNMSSVLQAGPCVRTNQLDFDDEVVFKARQYLYDHVREHAEQPFCLTVSMTHPHDPYTIPREYWDLYRDEDIPLPSVELAQHEQDPHSQRLLKVIDLWGKPLPPEKIRDARRAYFGACSYVDAQIGALLRTLEECDQAENTLVVFSGDHGDMLGERGLWYKMHWFEMAARVPMLIHAPGRFAARHVAESVSTLDLLPTLVELAGGELPADLELDGRSLLPHLQGQGGHDEVIGEYTAEGTLSPLMMIRRGDYKFVYSEQDPCLLYDLKNDPRELENLAGSAAHRELFDAFLAEARQRWDIPAITARVLASQRRRRFVADALQRGRLTSWDHQPFVDASQQYMRNHIDLDDLERRARYPRP
ncbi:choline-sulfatase [Pseudomonas citronellolis]|uniref:choline-sulfatase n=1 Tax=Pseudomonas citronellolis TaxID=53408 RepID=UPI00209E9A84|nr:choline-sulfatase [Pseudomonas citronellolis]MCP1641219.1 choline-sulfatase [Pseudomonas citronellolis]MCP1664137.1 choline-sulfatase [Pseudomonas citronellolis]MCP1695111.1 choline-sulfatase [Pseudomonas citronellolis]MCP1701972.1 choline-sulfatase [Pseudomonas citronellolis]MCP1795858.1 choline-sulfatase [Pseudomonas citronellolis]